ncbi:ATP-binding protein [Methyloversatilis discipulorum]|uniref:ATP-binding protein n=1 Tax=Methyloversatilis discipulorum TaxID=1119528 RepID=UPI001A4AB143|nr:ATP-binding protein [Methyloversatilis discipulorum]MBL8468007.1 hypothetical protein [Methyloversatilis discipulorum]
MLNSLYTRIAVSFAVIVACFGGALGALGYDAARTHQQEVSQSLSRGLAAHIAEHNRLAGRADVEELFHMLMAVNPQIEVYLLDADGRILMHSAPDGHPVRQQVGLAPLRAFLAGARLPILADNPRRAGRQDVFSVAPVLRAGGEPGYLYVVLAGEAYVQMSESAGLSYALSAGLWLGCAALCGALVAGLLVFRGITRRIDRLAGQVEAFLPAEAADESARSEGGKDEIARLQASFSRMSATIARQIEQLKEQDTLRRELVANVSHDLRTPLTALHNYLETLQVHADRLTEDARSDFLARAVRQSQGVARLAQQLFELARLECEEAPPQPEDFCINELLQDIRHKMTFAADAAGVTLDAGAAGDCLMVHADIGLIERVLTNLIDNALRCTPRGGTVRLGARRTGDGVEVDVADSGQGIAPDLLPTLFSRASPLRKPGGDPSRGGLGLLIVHRILTLHRTAIEVDSTPGQGTRFRFLLPVAGDLHPLPADAVVAS